MDLISIFTIIGVLGTFMFFVFNRLSADIKALDNKIDKLDDKLSNKIDMVDKRLIYIEAGIDFSGKTKTRDLKPVKTRKPRAKKNMQITLKNPEEG